MVWYTLDKHADIIQFIFHVPQLLSITRRKLCCISKSTMKHQHNSDLPRFSYGCWKGMVLILLIEYIAPPNCVHYRVTSALNMIFSVTYYLELHNAISIYCISCILSTNVKFVVWTLQNTNNFT